MYSKQGNMYPKQGNMYSKQGNVYYNKAMFTLIINIVADLKDSVTWLDWLVALARLGLALILTGLGTTWLTILIPINIVLKAIGSDPHKILNHTVYHPNTN
jgi:hypothetical protein